jgi:hypothetical protein
VGFEQSSYSVDEGEDLIVKVKRFSQSSFYGSHDSYPYFKVDYKTIQGSALSGQDYIHQTGTLEFFGGDPAQMESDVRIFAIPIPSVNDSESEEFFFIQLENARSDFAHIKLVENAEIKSEVKALITIKEDDS